jgi:hypothetical protein
MVILPTFTILRPGVIKVSASFYDHVSGAHSTDVTGEVSTEGQTGTTLRAAACSLVNQYLEANSLPGSATVEDVIV